MVAQKKLRRLPELFCWKKLRTGAEFLIYKKYRFEINLTSLLEKEKPQLRMHNLN